MYVPWLVENHLCSAGWQRVPPRGVSMHGDIWSISSADLRVGVVARGEAIVDAARSPAVKALWQTFSAARGGRPPSPRDYRASLPVGHGDFVVVAAETGDDRDPPDLEYVHYGHGIRRMTGLDLDGVRLSEMPATFRLTVVPLYFEVLRTGMPVFCVTHSSDAFVRSWQRAAFPCRVGDLPGLFVWLIPLEYRLTALNTFMNGSTEGMAAWRPMRDDGGAVEDFVCLYAGAAPIARPGAAPARPTGCGATFERRAVQRPGVG
jgi:hypothetical protein